MMSLSESRRRFLKAAAFAAGAAFVPSAENVAKLTEQSRSDGFMRLFDYV
jgi:hypothetical protein